MTPSSSLNLPKKFCLVAMLLVATGSVMAGPVLGTDITISDNNNNGSDPSIASNWYSDREDNETENTPNTIRTQQWDLEGMYRNGNILSLVGGYDFENGVYYQPRDRTYVSGDIFIDTNGNAVYGVGNTTSTGGTTSILYGYEYVLDLTYGSGGSGTYDIVQLVQGSTLLSRPTDVGTSSPWRLYSGGTTVGSGTFSYGTLTAAEATGYGLLGGDSNHGDNNTHYYITGFDLAFLPDGSDAVFHYTMECGNDDLMGRTHVAEPASTAMLLFGALLSLLGVRRIWS